MPRLKLPHLNLPSRRNGDRPPRNEHEKLVLVAEVAGFVVVTSIIAVFVLMVANSGSGGGQVADRPAVPTITDAGGSGADETAQKPAPPPAADKLPPPAAGGEREVVKPKPEPKPEPKPKPTPSPDENDYDGGDDGDHDGDYDHDDGDRDHGNGHGKGHDDDQVARPFDDCAPDGARAVTPRHHYPLECRNGMWLFA